MPLLADPLSGLRSFADGLVIDNYDNVFGDEACPLPDVVVRFGRYPVSKRCTQRLAAARSVNVVVDVAQTRDFNLATDLVRRLHAACVRAVDGGSRHARRMRRRPSRASAWRSEGIVRKGVFAIERG